MDLFVLFSPTKSRVSEESINLPLRVVEIAKADLGWGLVINWELVVRRSLSVLAAPLEEIRTGARRGLPVSGFSVQQECGNLTHSGILQCVLCLGIISAASFNLTWKLETGCAGPTHAAALPCLSVAALHTHVHKHMQTNTPNHTVPFEVRTCAVNSWALFLCSFSFRFAGLTSPPQPRLMRLYHREGSSAVGLGVRGIDDSVHARLRLRS